MEQQYKETLSDWYSKAAVRSRSPLNAVALGAAKKNLYNPNLIPVLNHNVIRRQYPGIGRSIELCKLKEYLIKTIYVESEIVNVAIEKIKLLVNQYDNSLILDAYKVYTDEAFHIVMMLELIKEIDKIENASTEILPSLTIQEIIQSFSSTDKCDDTGVPVIAAAIVTETLITASLNQAIDETLDPSIHELFYDHAKDEAKHHAFFTRFGKIYLSQLSPNDKRFVETYIPSVIFMFLSPEFALMKSYLIHNGVDSQLADQVIDESYCKSELKQGMLKSAKATLTLFDSTGFNMTESFNTYIDNNWKI